MAFSIKEKIYIIIVNYNCKPYIFDCLKSLKHQIVSSKQVKIIIVDNDSHDNSVQLIKEKSPAVQIIKNKKNFGFAKAVNIGIKKARQNKACYILLLNPDTKVKKDLLASLVKLINSNSYIGIVAPVLIDEDKNKAEYYTLGAKLNPFLGRVKHDRLKTPPLRVREEELVSGCAMFIKAKVFKKIGFFDERFFLYFEDSDFCLRAKKAGFKIFIEPKSEVFHQVGRSFNHDLSKKNFYNIKSNFLFINKHIKIYLRPIAYIYLLILTFKILISDFRIIRRK